MTGLLLPVAGSVPCWQGGDRAGGGGAAPVQRPGGRVQALAGRGGGGRPRAQWCLGLGGGVGGSFPRAWNQVLGLEVWREEEKSVSRE